MSDAPRQARVHWLAADGPDDLSAFDRAIETGEINPDNLVAVIGKTEGNGCVNDFSRGLATLAWKNRLGSKAANISLVMSGGTEGGLVPHWITLEVMEETEGNCPTSPALAVAVGRTRALEAWEIGTLTQTDLVAETIVDLIAEHAIDDVHFVQIKCPLLTAARIESAKLAGHQTVTADTLKSMGLSRGASALGVAKALGETEWSSVASASAGIELMACEIVVLGMSSRWTGPLAIDHAVMSDAFDIEPVRAAFARLDIQAVGQLTSTQRHQLIALLAKAEASPDGHIRGQRHTMLDDSDVSATRHARGLVGGVLGGLIGHGALYVSGGAEFQGPPGGGPVAIIVSKEV